MSLIAHVEVCEELANEEKLRPVAPLRGLPIPIALELVAILTGDCDGVLGRIGARRVVECRIKGFGGGVWDNGDILCKLGMMVVGVVDL